MGKLLDRVAKRLGYMPAKRAFQAADVGRLTADWIFSPLSGDAELRTSLRTLRTRSRDLANNNPWIRRYLRVTAKNVVGPTGIKLVMNAVREDFETPDPDANRRVMEAWRNWGRSGVCTVDGRFSWVEAQNAIVRHTARDGEFLINMISGTAAPNDFGFALQLIEADLLDEELNIGNFNGNEIRMGVEINGARRPVAYHILTRHPGDTLFASQSVTSRHVRIPAENMIHVYRADRVSQTRGFPDTVAVMYRLKMLGGYEEAALVAARAGAAKMGFLEQDTPDAAGVEGMQKDGSGNAVQETNPGQIEALPPGVKFKEFDPGYPDGDLAPFTKSLLHGTSAGLNLSYHTLASDLEGVNYSSGRLGLLDDREEWRTYQNWLIEHVHSRIFAAWLPNAMATGQINLPFRIIPRLRPTWRARGWDWVDPQKDEAANETAIANGTRSRTDILNARGQDFDEVLRELADEEAKADQAGVDITPKSNGQNSGVDPNADQSN